MSCMYCGKGFEDDGIQICEDCYRRLKHISADIRKERIRRRRRMHFIILIWIFILLLSLVAALELHAAEFGIPTPIKQDAQCCATCPINEPVEPVIVTYGITTGSVVWANVSHYCSCPLCCGVHADGLTADGTRAEAGDASCNWLPAGSIVRINGDDYTICDTGSPLLDTIGFIDVYVPEGHQKALELGRLYTEVIIIRIGYEG